MDWIWDFLREFLWGITGLVLGIADIIFSLLKTISGITFTDYQNLWSWWGLLCFFIGGFVILRLFKMYIKILMQEEDEKVQLGKGIMRLIPLMIVLTLLPLVLSYFGSVSTYLTRNAAVYTGSNPDMTLSEIIINATSFDGDIVKELLTPEDNSGEAKIVYTLKDVNSDINKKDSNGKYVYFPNFGSFLLGLVSGCVTAGMMLLISLEYVQRLFAIVLKILISPIPISSIIDPASNSFGRWVRSIAGDWTTNFVQILFIHVVLIISNSGFVNQYGIAVQLVILMGGIFTVLKGVPAVVEFIGGDIGSGSVIQQLGQMNQAKQMASSVGSGVLGATLGAGVTAAAMMGHGAVKGAAATGMIQGLTPAKAFRSQSGSEGNDGKSSYTGDKTSGKLLSKLDSAMSNRISNSVIGRGVHQVSSAFDISDKSSPDLDVLSQASVSSVNTQSFQSSTEKPSDLFKTQKVKGYDKDLYEAMNPNRKKVHHFDENGNKIEL